MTTRNMDMSRRTLLKSAALLGGVAAGPARMLTQVSPGVAKTLAACRAQMAATPIEAVKLTNPFTLFTGPGGNVLVRNGEEGKVVVDTFVQGAFPGLKQRIDAMDHLPILFAINTSWLFDHTDNNESFREAGAQIVAHENTRRRLSEPHDLLGMHFNPAPAAAMPTQTFTQFHNIEFKGTAGTEEYIDLEYVPRAQTDTDIYVHFVMGDVLHLGGTFSNGMYPFIEAGTGGSIDGMIAAAGSALKAVNPGTKIVPGYGSLADGAALRRYRDMLVIVRDRVQKLKTAGRSEPETVAAKPTADLDATWGQGFIQPEVFVSMVYKTL
jgi:cyclase